MRLRLDGERCQSRRFKDVRLCTRGSGFGMLILDFHTGWKDANAELTNDATNLNNETTMAIQSLEPSKYVSCENHQTQHSYH